MNKAYTLLCIIVICILMVGCATAPSSRTELDKILAEIAEADAQLDPHGVDSTQGSGVTEIPVEVNEKIKNWLEYFTNGGRERFSEYMSRGTRYRKLIMGVLAKHQIPTEFYYLALIESGYMVHAMSRQRAVGIWQFIRPTAKRYGLRVDRYVDERRDPIRSTDAAARYLKDLHKMFGSWHLAMAGYNAGEGRMRQAIQKGQSHKFWVLAQKGVLPTETMHYIPKFLAALMIGRNPEKFGFKPTLEEAYPEMIQASVPPAEPLSSISHVTKISEADLCLFNPHLVKKITPTGTKSYRVWIPKANLQQSKYAKLAQLSKGVFRVPASSPSHRVKRGENLTGIAKRYGISSSRLRKLNRLSSDTIHAGQYLKIREKDI
jgi:membrane-bound lytic murein transglycosylase D